MRSALMLESNCTAVFAAVSVHAAHAPSHAGRPHLKLGSFTTAKALPGR
jgi:hypothetical protein